MRLGVAKQGTEIAVVVGAVVVVVASASFSDSESCIIFAANNDLMLCNYRARGVPYNYGEKIIHMWENGSWPVKLITHVSDYQIIKQSR